METEDKQHSYRIPMIELITMLGVFVIVSAFIAKMFISTNRLQYRAANISHSLMKVETVAEYIKGSNRVEETFSGLGAKAMKDSDHYVIYYDKDWNPVSNEDAFIIIINHREEKSTYGILDIYEIKAYDFGRYSAVNGEEEPLSDLTVKKYSEQ